MNTVENSLYYNASEPTEPRFNVGDIVYTNGVVIMPGYRVSIDNKETIDHLINRNDYESGSVIVEPGVFGVICEYPEPGTMILDGGTIETFWLRWRRWRGVEHDREEVELDFPDSGSIWFLLDNERRYFVKWINKETHKYSDTPKFAPLKSTTGEKVFNIALYGEKELKKAPDFVSIMREKVKKRKFKDVETLLNNGLNIDACSINGIACMVCEYYYRV
jgi:hypothetical protein